MRPNPLRRGLIALPGLFLAYTVIAISFTGCQRSMMYHPSRFSPKLANAMAAKDNLRPWTNKNGERIGWHYAGTDKGQVLVVHGNAGSAMDRMDLVRGIRSIRSWNIHLLEYPGYGDRSGSPTEETILAAATEGLALLTNNGGVYVAGESLGTGVACYLAGKFSNSVSGVVLFCPYNSIADVAQYHMRWLPVKWMLWDRYPAEKWLKGYRGPVGVLVATHDTIVPARFGLKLYSSYNGPKKLWEINVGGHNDMCKQSPEWWRELVSFWEGGAPALP